VLFSRAKRNDLVSAEEKRDLRRAQTPRQTMTGKIRNGFITLINTLDDGEGTQNFFQEKERKKRNKK
jgi:hypothetical protein